MDDQKLIFGSEYLIFLRSQLLKVRQTPSVYLTAIVN